MNTETGEIARMEGGDLIRGDGSLVPEREKRLYAPIERLPTEDCPKCKGKGYIGRNVATKKLIPCHCIGAADFSTIDAAKTQEYRLGELAKLRAKKAAVEESSSPEELQRRLKKLGEWDKSL